MVKRIASIGNFHLVSSIICSFQIINFSLICQNPLLLLQIQTQRSISPSFNFPIAEFYLNMHKNNEIGCFFVVGCSLFLRWREQTFRCLPKLQTSFRFSPLMSHSWQNLKTFLVFTQRSSNELAENFLSSYVTSLAQLELSLWTRNERRIVLE